MPVTPSDTPPGGLRTRRVRPGPCVAQRGSVFTGMTDPRREVHRCSLYYHFNFQFCSFHSKILGAGDMYDVIIENYEK